MAGNSKGSGRGLDRVQKGELQFFGDFMCMKGDSLAVHERDKLARSGKGGRRTATATAPGSRVPIPYGVFGGSEMLVDANMEGPKGKQQEVFVHVDGVAPKNAPSVPSSFPSQDNPLPHREQPSRKNDSRTAHESRIHKPQNIPGSSKMVFDTASGISAEEQQEILVHINGIAERNRQSLAAETEDGKGAGKRLKAKKNGGLFPILVNFFAIAALAGGLYALYSLQDEAGIQARQGIRVFNPMERTIIDEIRRETSDMLGVKDMEIAIITHFLAEVEAQMELIADSEILTPEQLATYGQLMERQERLRMELAQAQEGRSRILNEAHIQEAVVQAQFNTRIQIETQMQEFVAIGEVPPPEKLAAHEQLRSQQEAFHEALAMAREERSLILSETRAREAELQAQLDAHASIEAQLRGLIAGGVALTPEQQAAHEQLRSQQEELSEALALAWDERSLILDEARMREAELQAQLNVRIHDLAPHSHTPDPELEAVLDEFARLSMDQTQAERAETMIAGLFASARRQIAENRFHEAEETILSLRVILNDPIFQVSRAAQPRREFYVHATDTLEELLTRYSLANEAIRTGVLPPDRDAEIRLEQEIARLMGELEAMENTINTMGATEADLAQFVAQLENTIGNLQSTNATLNSQVGILQQESATLNSQVGTLQQESITLNSQVGTLQQESATLNSQMGILQQENTTLNSQVGTLQQESATLNSQVGTLQQENTVLNSQVGTLQQENATLNSQMATLQRESVTLDSQMALQQENATLNSQVNTLQQENATLNSQVDTLRTDINRQAQLAENLRQDVQSLRTTNMSLSNQLNQLRDALLYE